MGKETETAKHKYTSNPFAAAAVGLGKALTVNPIATLMLAVLPFVIIFAAHLLFLVFATTLDDSPGLLIAGAIAAGVATLVAMVRATLGAIYVLKASLSRLMFVLEMELRPIKIKTPIMKSF